MWDDERVRAYDMENLISEELEKDESGGNVEVRVLSNALWQTTVIYKCKSCTNILTLENLKAMASLERKILQINDWPLLCQATSTADTGCSASSYESFASQFLNPETATQADLDAKLTELTTDPTFTDKKHLFDKSFSSSNKESTITRATFALGSPLEIDGVRYKDKTDRTTDQDKHAIDFGKSVDSLLDENQNANMDQYVFSVVFMNDFVFQIITNDFLWVTASFVFVWGYMTFHLRSFFLSSCSMLNILMSFFITLVLYRGIMRIDYFSFLHILAVFVVLGVAADDVFVYTDAFQQACAYPQLKDDLHKQIAYSQRRASKAIFVTSFTTAVAFLATGFSALMPISTFGFFAAIIIPVNYLLVITVYPPVLVIWKKYVSTRCCTCCQKKKEDSVVLPDPPEREENATTSKAETHESGSKIERFFKNKWSAWMFKGRVVVVPLLIVWIGICIWRSFLIEPLSEEESFIPDDLEPVIALNTLNDDFNQGEDDLVVKVKFIWGASHVDRSSAAKWDPSEFGSIVWDENLNLAPSANQERIRTICSDLRASSLVKDSKVTCFMDDFKTYIEG